MAPNVTKKNKPTPMPVGKALRQAGEGGITKQEFKEIAGKKSAGSVIQRLDKINKKIRQNDGVGISLNSGAANMLIRQAAKNPNSFDSYLSNLGGGFGTGRIGSVLQARAGKTGLTGKPGDLMLGGTAIRPGGREAVQGFGKQYALPTKPPAETLPGGGGGDTLTGGDGGDMLPFEEFIPPAIIPPVPTNFPPEMDSFSVNSMATNWRSRNKGKGKGIRSTSAASRGSRSMPSSNTLAV
jgi:hypothetical protein